MSNERIVVENVLEFIGRAADDIAAFEREQFFQESFGNVIEAGMESPIEDLFWIAMKALCRSNFEGFNEPPDDLDGKPVFKAGVYVRPQVRVGDYRVDFVVSREPFLEVQRCTPVVVELDGHAFHDKDKKQRAYEKARDRYLVRDGYRVVHFTGSEIVADPYAAAHEVLCLINAASSPVYDPRDPLGVGN